MSQWNAISSDGLGAQKPPVSLSLDGAISLSRDALETEADDGDEDDDISLVSRTPSPPIPDSEENLHRYDEYIRGAAREIITVETKIKPSNKGYTLLTKLGWSEGQPLGLSGDGRIEPIPFHVKADLTGLGKMNQDVRMIETTVSQRRELDSERQQRETEEQRRAREDSVLRRAALKTEISTTLKAFYCSLCEKQFKTVAQYDEHTNSYAHHHKARFKDMQTSQRLVPQDELDRRKEKERRREVKELRKMAAAAGVKMARPMAQPISSGPSSVLTNSELGNSPLVPKKSGWTAISSSAETLTVQSGFKRTGWSTVGAALSVDSKPQAQAHHSPHVVTAAPSFRTGGWTSLDTGGIQSQPPPPSSAVQASFTEPQPPPSAPSDAGYDSSRFTGHAADDPELSSNRRTSPQQRPASAISSQSRSSWQQFKQTGAKRRHG